MSMCVDPLSDSHLQHRELISKTRKWHWATIGPQHLLHSPSWETGREREEVCVWVCVCVCVIERIAVQQAGTVGTQLPMLECGAHTGKYKHTHTHTKYNPCRQTHMVQLHKYTHAD